jgi:hypothetical protein
MTNWKKEIKKIVNSIMKFCWIREIEENALVPEMIFRMNCLCKICLMLDDEVLKFNQKETHSNYRQTVQVVTEQNNIFRYRLGRV